MLLANVYAGARQRGPAWILNTPIIRLALQLESLLIVDMASKATAKPKS